MSFFFQRSKTPCLQNENKILDLTADSYQNNDLVCEDCDIYLQHDAKHSETSETKHFYVCPKCSQVTSTDDPIIKRKGRLGVLVGDDVAPIISIVNDEPPKVQISKRMKFGRREERITDSLFILNKKN